MGSAPWDCFTSYKADLRESLQGARQNALKTGEYSCSCPGTPTHDSFEDAMECADADGTCSIIDIEEISMDALKGEMDENPCVAYALSPEQLEEFFGTAQPTREIVETSSESGEWYDLLGRGCAIHVTVFSDGKPSEVYFAGMSFD